MLAGTDDIRVRDEERAMGDEETARWLQQVRAEYLEMPGLHLTLPQMQRLWGLSGAACEALVNALVEQHFLAKADDDSYALDGRASDALPRGPRPAAGPAPEPAARRMNR
jgi:hypothetical protein